MTARAGSQKATLLLALHRTGAGTASEIADRCPLDYYQVARRLADLEQDGLSEPTGDERKGPSGFPQRVHRLTPGGQHLARKLQEANP